MRAARDLALSGQSVEAFFAKSPELHTSFTEDAAFHEGFAAYLYARTHLPPPQLEELDRSLDLRDGWRSQTNVAVRG
jgi:hypothetical protein